MAHPNVAPAAATSHVPGPATASSVLWSVVAGPLWSAQATYLQVSVRSTTTTRTGAASARPVLGPPVLPLVVPQPIVSPPVADPAPVTDPTPVTDPAPALVTDPAPVTDPASNTPPTG